MKNENIIIVGSSRGIGAHIAENIFENTQYNLILCSRSLSTFRKNFKKKLLSSSRVKIKILDVSNENNIRNLLNFIKKNKLKLKGIINCSGVVGKGGKISNILTNDWDNTIKTNLYGTFFLYKYFVDYLAKRKTKTFIINFSGGGGTGSFPYLDSYAVSKVAINRLCENVSEEYEKTNFITFSISPGSINTKMFYDFAKQSNKLGKKLKLEIKDRLINGGADIQNPTNLILFFLENIGNLSHLSGRIISAQFDSIEKLIRNKKHIINSDLLKLRRIDKKVVDTEIL